MDSIPAPFRFFRDTASAVLTLFALSACGGDGGTQPNPGGDGGGGSGGGGTPTVSAPGSLGAEALSANRIRLTWTDNSTNETGFQVERSPDGSAWSRVADLAAATTSHEDRGLEADTRYVYRVRAVSSANTSTWSPTAEARTVAGEFGRMLEIETTIAETLPPSSTPLEQRNLLQEVEAVGEALRTVPGVDTVFVWGRVLTAQAVLEDGTTHLFIHNRPPELEALTPAPPSATPGGASPAARIPRSPTTAGPAAVKGPPGSARAVTAAVDGGDAVAQEVADMLTAAGYEVLSMGADVEEMRQYKDLGALYLDTHGTGWGLVEKDANGGLSVIDETFGIQTSTVIQGNSLSRYISELLSGDLVYATVKQGGNVVATKYAVTKDFIAKHWSFDDGVVMIHACYAGSGPFTMGGGDFDPTEVADAVLAGGAEVYASFDHLTLAPYARPSILFFWDRLLGADVYDRQDPPLRPFPVPQVRQAMADEDLLNFQRPQNTLPILGFTIASWGGNEVNVTFRGGTEQTTAAPSIRTADIADDAARGTGELTLNGLFGSKQGTVEIEGVQAPVSSWSQDRIVADVPFDGFGSTGPIVVKTPDGVKSNEAPLTEWVGVLTATTDMTGNLKAEAVVDLRFRADVHGFRQAPGDDPEHRRVSTWINPSSKGTSRGSGSHTYPDGSRLTFSGAYDLRILNKAEIDGGGVQPSSSALGVKVELDPDAGEAEICVILWGEVDVQADSDPAQKTVLVYGSAPFLVAGSSLGLFGCATVNMDRDTFVIDAFQKSFSADDVTYTIKWDQLRPFSPPDDRTAG